MLIRQDELEQLHKRFPYPRFSQAEYERRYRNIWAMMKEKNLDCLLIVGGSAAYGRLWFNLRYVTNMMGKAEMAMMAEDNSKPNKKLSESSHPKHLYCVNCAIAKLSRVQNFAQESIVPPPSRSVSHRDRPRFSFLA